MLRMRCFAFTVSGEYLAPLPWGEAMASAHGFNVLLRQRSGSRAAFMQAVDWNCLPALHSPRSARASALPARRKTPPVPGYVPPARRKMLSAQAYDLPALPEPWRWD